MKKLAVLLPTFNAASYLKESIDSVLNQSYANFDLYIYDDCSTDTTEDIVSTYTDTRIFYRKNQENLGIAKTLNLGLKELLPNYEYIARMDADDWCYPERFVKQLNYLELHKDVVLCGTQGFWLKDFNKISANAWTYPINNNFIKLNLLFAATFGHSSIMLRSHCMLQNNLRYNEQISTCEDWELWTHLVKQSRTVNLEDFLMKYRILEGSNHRSSLKTEIHFKERSTIISNYWSNFNINLLPEEVYLYYYGNTPLTKLAFYERLKKIISVFNQLYETTNQELNVNDRRNFSYLLARRILDFWKRSKISRFNIKVWFILISEVSFMNKIKLIKSSIR